MERIIIKSIIEILLVIIIGLIFSIPVVADETIFINGIGDVEINEESSIDNIEINGKNVWNELFNKYKGLVLGFSGIAALTMVLFFIVSFVKLGKSGDNPEKRSSAISGLFWTGIATTILGSIAVLVALFYNALV